MLRLSGGLELPDGWIVTWPLVEMDVNETRILFRLKWGMRHSPLPWIMGRKQPWRIERADVAEVTEVRKWGGLGIRVLDDHGAWGFYTYQKPVAEILVAMAHMGY
jgi:hypothetical protein